MYGTVKLSTSKYLDQVYRTERKQTKRLRNRKAINDFCTFAFGLLAIGVGVRLVETMPTWLPSVEALFAK